jgi:uncharacterized protein involved in exopolysaccharide biosynthesis
MPGAEDNAQQPGPNGRARGESSVAKQERSLAQMIGQRKGLFAAVLVATTALAAAVSWRMPPVYEGKTTLLLETQKASDKVALVTAQNPFQQAPDINNEVQMLRSRTLVTATATALGAIAAGTA